MTASVSVLMAEAQYLMKSNLRKGGRLILAHSWRMRSILVGKQDRGRGWLIICPPPPPAGSRDSWTLVLSLLYPLYSVQDHSPWADAVHS